MPVGRLSLPNGVSAHRPERAFGPTRQRSARAGASTIIARSASGSRSARSAPPACLERSSPRPAHRHVAPCAQVTPTGRPRPHVCQVAQTTTQRVRLMSRCHTCGGSRKGAHPCCASRDRPCVGCIDGQSSEGVGSSHFWRSPWATGPTTRTASGTWSLRTWSPSGIGNPPSMTLTTTGRPRQRPHTPSISRPRTRRFERPSPRSWRRPRPRLGGSLRRRAVAAGAHTHDAPASRSRRCVDDIRRYGPSAACAGRIFVALVRKATRAHPDASLGMTTWRCRSSS